MFGFGRKRVHETALRIGRAAVICRGALRDNDLQVLRNVMGSHDNFTPIRLTGSGPSYAVAGWTEGPEEGADISFLVASMDGLDGRTELRLIAEGRGRLLGLMMLAGTEGSINVETSDALQATGGLGANTEAVRRELLALPGFGSMETLLASLGVKRRR